MATVEWLLLRKERNLQVRGGHEDIPVAAILTIILAIFTALKAIKATPPSSYVTGNL